ncbi:MAG: GntR family transcriptional regulator [Erysipelotrichaceae bacterium]|nr:GntR family transcriptional regulator [Erysipelotrichaceae bacterium]
MAKNPKYIEIANYFIEKIKNSELKPNDALESEEVLCSKFNVSHMTMTKAMNELSLEGYIKRTPGKGTFVSDNYKASIKKAFSSRSSITSQIIEAGMEPRTELYRYYIIKGKDLKGVAENLNVDDNEFIHGFIRLRYAGEKMMAISYTYIVQKMIPTIDISRLEGSFNKYVEELGIHRSYGETEFCAVMPEGENEKILGTNHIPLLKQTILWNVDDKPFELTYHYFVGSSYSITSDLQIIHN